MNARWGINLGSIFALLVAGFIYLYASREGWGLLALLAKIYIILNLLIIGLVALGILVPLAIALIIGLIALVFYIFHRNSKSDKEKGHIKVKYKVE